MWALVFRSSSRPQAAAVPSGWPDATTTGVPDGTSLTPHSGDLTTTSNGQVIDSLNVSGTIMVVHTNVTVRKCRALEVFVDTGGDGITIEDCDIVGGAGNSAISLVNSNNATIQRCDISGVENGIWLEANGCQILDNYVHDLADPGNIDPHFDGIDCQVGGDDCTIDHNNFALAQDVSSTLKLKAATNFTVNNNRLNGGTYIVYFEVGASGNVVTNNLFGQHLFGYVSGDGAEQNQTYSGNYDQNGNPLTLP